MRYDYIPSGPATKAVDRAAVAFGGLGLRRGDELRHGFAFGCQFGPQFDARFRLAIQSAGHRSGATHVAERQDVDLKPAALRLDLQPIANVHFARRFDVLTVRLHTAEFAGSRGKRASLEEPGSP